MCSSSVSDRMPVSSKQERKFHRVTGLVVNGFAVCPGTFEHLKSVKETFSREYISLCQQVAFLILFCEALWAASLHGGIRIKLIVLLLLFNHHYWMHCRISLPLANCCIILLGQWET